MSKENRENGRDIPLGLGMALAQNTDAMARFTALTPQTRRELLLRAKHARSKAEMQALVAQLAQGEQLPPSQHQ